MPLSCAAMHKRLATGGCERRRPGAVLLRKPTDGSGVCQELRDAELESFVEGLLGQRGKHAPQRGAVPHWQVGQRAVGKCLLLLDQPEDEVVEAPTTTSATPSGRTCSNTRVP